MVGQFRVLIADDQAIARTGLVTLVASMDDATVIGTAANGEECVRLAVELRPDVVVIDLHASVLGGIEATRRIGRMAPAVGIMLVTIFDDDAAVFPALRAGARGYLVKDSDGEELERAIRTVARGGAIFSPAIARRVMRYLANSPPITPKSAFDELTARELQTLELIAHGLTNAEIGERLGLSVKTVSNNVSKILLKLDAPDRARLMLLALDTGMGRPVLGGRPPSGDQPAADD